MEPLGQQKAVETTIRTKSGDVIWAAVTYGVISGASGEIKGVVHNIRDMSGQKEVQRLKDEFMSTISHELRTPLTAILGYDEMLLKGIRGPVTSKQEETLRSIRSNALRLLSLINDLLDVTRLESGEVALFRKSLDMRAAVEKALSSVATLAATKGLVLQQELPEDLPTVLADEDKFQQILYNLLSNAIKFTPDGKTITVAARPKTVRVQDPVDRRPPIPFETVVMEV
jgi:signal transduction histidine kinase